MLNIMLNGEPLELAKTITLSELVLQQAITGSFAIAVNQTFVPKTLWPTTTLSMGDQVELVAPMQGG